ncbi:MAG: Short chain fatty acid transporter [Acidobacteria bacterium 13_1_40CM_2_68_5]|nr:MAG: Short chain fatty acid transporter [Acidobacteria bacterium 13_1_40CM_2_68_5]
MTAAGQAETALSSDAPLARAGAFIAGACERYFPDAFVFALAAVLFVFLFGWALGERPLRLVSEFGGGFWGLVPFTMQMALVIVGGFVVAGSPPLARLIVRLARVPRTPRGAVAFVAFFAMAASLLSWGLSLVFTGLLVREVARRIEGIDYRAICSAAYLGLGSVWALGLSSSAALLQATRSSIPEGLLPITGVIPLSRTIFLWQSLTVAAVLIAVSVAVAYLSCPAAGRARTAAAMGVLFEAKTIEIRPPATPAERLENNPVLGVAIALLMLAFLAVQLRDKGVVAALDLNNFNFAFLALGLLLHLRPASFLRAVGRAVPATAGVLIQFPFYAGIFGIISNTAIKPLMADLFVRITTRGTFPLVVALYSAVLGMFVPSGGGKWIIEAPYVMAAANAWHVHLGWTVQIYNAAEALPNLINPFWMLPLMGILNVRARDLAGYSMLQLLFHVPIVFLLCWLFSLTLPYSPPVVP